MSQAGSTDNREVSGTRLQRAFLLRVQELSVQLIIESRHVMATCSQQTNSLDTPAAAAAAAATDQTTSVEL